MGVGIWCFGCYLLLVSQSKIEAVFASRILQFGSIPIPILQLHFAYLFINISKKRRGLLCAGYVLTFILLIEEGGFIKYIISLFPVSNKVYAIEFGKKISNKIGLYFSSSRHSNLCFAVTGISGASAKSFIFVL